MNWRYTHVKIAEEAFAADGGKRSERGSLTEKEWKGTGRQNEDAYRTKDSGKNSIGRLVFVALSVLLQVIWICVQAMKLNRYSTWISVATSVLTLVVVILLYGRRTNAAFKMPWIILILAFPVLVLGMYLLFGRKEATQLVRERFERIDQSLDGLLIQDKAGSDKAAADGPDGGE